ncbi:hypothetical protein ABBQ38_007434 [Trebouxia sp. C0009 RCD-2024]
MGHDEEKRSMTVIGVTPIASGSLQTGDHIVTSNVAFHTLQVVQFVLDFRRPAEYDFSWTNQAPLICSILETEAQLKLKLHKLGEAYVPLLLVMHAGGGLTTASRHHVYGVMNPRL